MLKLEIISPKEKVFSTEAKQVVLPTESGEIGLLTGHIPLGHSIEIRGFESD